MEALLNSERPCGMIPVISRSWRSIKASFAPATRPANPTEALIDDLVNVAGNSFDHDAG
jgi:hypothetical protein